MNQNLNKKFMAKEDNVYVYLRNPKSGREFEVKKSEVRHYKNCEVIGEVVVPSITNEEAPVISAKTIEPRSGMLCDECEFSTLSKGGLTRHKNSKHGKPTEDVQEA